MMDFLDYSNIYQTLRSCALQLGFAISLSGGIKYIIESPEYYNNGDLEKAIASTVAGAGLTAIAGCLERITYNQN